MYNLREASEVVGKSKATLSIAIKNGKLSAKRTKLSNGRYKVEIDHSELLRVYPPKQKTTETEQNQTHSWTPPNNQKDTEINRLETELKAALDKIDALKERNEEIKGDRDAWRNQATALLASPSRTEDETRTLWQKIFGK